MIGSRRGFLGSVLGTIAGIPFVAREPKPNLGSSQSVWSVNINTNKGLIEGPKFVSEKIVDGKIQLFFGELNILQSITFYNAELYYKGIPLFTGRFDHSLLNGDIFSLSLTLKGNSDA